MENETMRSINQVWEEELLASGETTELKDDQQVFSEWMQDEDPASSPGAVWLYEEGFGENESRRENFFRYIAEHIRSIPPEHYLLRYLLARYRINLGKSDFQELCRFMKEKKYSLSMPRTIQEGDSRLAALQEKFSLKECEAPLPIDGAECKDILCGLCCGMLAEYPADLASSGTAWTTRFKGMLKSLTVNSIHFLALGLNWDWRTYQLFRAKALKRRYTDFMDREEILLFLALNYAECCGLTAYEGYAALDRLYPVPSRQPDRKEKKKQKDGMTREERDEIRKKEKQERQEDSGSSSEQLQNRLLGSLERDGSLLPEYTETLFFKRLPFLEEVFADMEALKGKKVKRSPFVVLLEEWNRFAEAVGRFEYTEDDTKDGEYSVSGYVRSRHELFRWLYGENVESAVYEGKTRGIRDLSKENMVSLSPPGVDNFFLDSREFLETRLRDTDFNQLLYSGNEVRQRNLLLTVGFLNFAYTDLDSIYAGTEDADYQQRIAFFEFEMQDLLNECGFLSLHSGGAYDAFLKLLLSCDEPVELFRHIWHLKTGSPFAKEITEGM